METVKTAAKYITEYEPVFLYLYAKQHDLSRAQSMKAAKLKLEQSKRRIKEIEVFNSEKGADGKKHVPIKIHFRAAGIITIPDEKEILAAMEEIRKNPHRVA